MRLLAIFASCALVALPALGAPVAISNASQKFMPDTWLAGFIAQGRNLWAQVPPRSDNPFAALVGRRAPRQERRPASIVERYQLASDGRVFLFEDLGATARITFPCTEQDTRLECRLDSVTPSSEIFVLTPTRAPRGDVIYKDDLGGTFLRIASYGGATVYWPGERNGRAASKSFGEEKTLTLAQLSPDAAYTRASAATAALSAMTGGPIVFDVGSPAVAQVPNTRMVLAQAEPERSRMMREEITVAGSRFATTQGPAGEAETSGMAKAARADGVEAAPAPALDSLADASPAALEADLEDNFVAREASPQIENAGVIADAVTLVAKGIAGVARDKTGAQYITKRIGRVVFRPDSEPGLALEGRTLVVRYNPNDDLNGRPSSAMVTQFLEESL